MINTDQVENGELSEKKVQWYKNHHEAACQHIYKRAEWQGDWVALCPDGHIRIVPRHTVANA